MQLFILLFSWLLVFPTWATTFAPLNFEKQLREADAVIEGEFLGASSMRTADEQVLTQATFLVKRSVGFAQGDVANKQRLVVVYPGGNWQGINYSVQGSPKFKKGEAILMILSKGQYGYTLSNLALSKYKIEWQDGEKQLVSDVFPTDPNLGRIPFSKVEKNIHNVFGRGMDEIVDDRHVGINENEIQFVSDNVGRAPASSETPPASQPSGMKAGFWLGLLLGILGLVSVWFARQRR